MAVSKLYEGLKYNPELIERINEEIEKYIKNLKENADTIGDIQNIAKDEMLMSLIDCNIDGYKEVKTALDLFVKLYEENKNLPEKDKNDIFGNLFSALIEIIEGIVGCYAGLDVDIVKENSKIVLKNLLKNSKLAGKLKEATADYNTIIGPVKDKIKEYEEK